MPLIERAADPERLKLFLVGKLYQRVGENLKENEEIFFDDLLIKVASQLEKTDFCHQLNSKYKAVIIDEFQDTDPVQWKIFSSIFNAANGFQGIFTVVGDPKQSIYAFRSADIYTYLEAKKKFLSTEQAYLEINYRSDPLLIEGLNRLFSLGEQNKLFRLPKDNTYLSYLPVKRDVSKNNKEWKDGKKPIHFFFVHSSCLI